MYEKGKHYPYEPSRRRRSSPVKKLLLILGFLSLMAIAFSAGALVVLIGVVDLPDSHDLFESPVSGCQIYPSSERGNPLDVNIIIHGSRQNHTTVDLYLPNSRNALPVKSQYDKKFIDTEELYIQQVYDWDTSWRSGVYEVIAVMNGKRYTKTWRVSESAGVVWNVYVECN